MTQVSRSFRINFSYFINFLFVINLYNALITFFSFTTLNANTGSTSGTVFMPPKWSLGYHQCRWSYDSDQKVLKVHCFLNNVRHIRLTSIPSMVSLEKYGFEYISLGFSSYQFKLLG